MKYIRLNERLLNEELNVKEKADKIVNALDGTFDFSEDDKIYSNYLKSFKSIDNVLSRFGEPFKLSSLKATKPVIDLDNVGEKRINSYWILFLTLDYFSNIRAFDSDIIEKEYIDRSTEDLVGVHCDELQIENKLYMIVNDENVVDLVQTEAAMVLGELAYPRNINKFFRNINTDKLFAVDTVIGDLNMSDISELYIYHSEIGKLNIGRGVTDIYLLGGAIDIDSVTSDSKCVIHVLKEDVEKYSAVLDKLKNRGKNKVKVH